MELEQLLKNQKCLQILLAPKGTQVYHQASWPPSCFTAWDFIPSCNFRGLEWERNSRSCWYFFAKWSFRHEGFRNTHLWTGGLHGAEKVDWGNSLRPRFTWDKGAVGIARAFASSDIPLPDYNIATWNWETFVLVCIWTGR